MDVYFSAKDVSYHHKQMKTYFFSKFMEDFNKKIFLAILTLYALEIFKFCDLTTALHWLVKTISDQEP